MLIGPVTAAICLQVSGPGAVYGVAAVGLLTVGLLVLAVNPRRGATSFVPDRVKGAWEGFRELRRRPGARVLLGFVAGQTVVIGALDVLTVVLAMGVLSMGPSGPGVLSAAVGIGGLVGAAATVVLIGRDRLSGPFLVGVVGVGLPIAFVAAIPSVAAALVLLAVSGVGKSFLDVTARTLLQRSVDDDVLAYLDNPPVPTTPRLRVLEPPACHPLKVSSQRIAGVCLGGNDTTVLNLGHVAALAEVNHWVAGVSLGRNRSTIPLSPCVQSQDKMKRSGNCKRFVCPVSRADNIGTWQVTEGTWFRRVAGRV